MKKKISSPLIILCLVIMTGFAFIVVSAESPPTKEEIVVAYMKALEENSGTAVAALFSSTDLGMDPTSSNNLYVEQEAAEKQGLLSSTVSTYGRNTTLFSSYVVNDQRAFITTQFGKDAWENIEYSFEEYKHYDGPRGFINKATGKQITKAAYEKLNYEYWSDLAKTIGVTYEELFSFNSPDLDTEKAYQYHTLIMENIEDMPAEMTVFPEYEMLKVKLTFNGKEETMDGYSDFHFLISNKNGEWEICKGLSWLYPEEDIL